MGIDYYVRCSAREDLYELDGGAWGGLDLTPAHVDVFAQRVLACWLRGNVKKGLEAYALDVGHDLWRWCDERNWQVYLGDDYEFDCPDWCDWPVTGSRFKL